MNKWTNKTCFNICIEERQNGTVGLYPKFWLKRLRGINNNKNDDKHNNINTRCNTSTATQDQPATGHKK